MAANNARHGLALIASENWIGAENFLPIGPVADYALCDPRVRAIWAAFPDPTHRAEALRLWFLMRNPWEVYADSDCIIHAIPPTEGKPLAPSIQRAVEKLAASFGGEPDMDDIRNASGHWLDVWAIVGAGDASFFDAWLSLWTRDFFRPGGISEALSHGPFNVGVLPEACYTHFSTRKKDFHESPIAP